MDIATPPNTAPIIAGDEDTGEPVRFDTKIVIVVRDDLAAWQRLNVTAFLAGGVAGAQSVLGEPYADADGNAYLPMFRQPVLVLAASAEVLRAAHERALRRGMRMSVFTTELFGTGNDRDNRAAVRAVPAAKLDLVGIGLHGAKNAVDKVVKGASMHP